MKIVHLHMLTTLKIPVSPDITTDEALKIFYEHVTPRPQRLRKLRILGSTESKQEKSSVCLNVKVNTYVAVPGTQPMDTRFALKQRYVVLLINYSASVNASMKDLKVSKKDPQSPPALALLVESAQPGVQKVSTPKHINKPNTIVSGRRTQI
jgi:hypothetical protein